MDRKGPAGPYEASWTPAGPQDPVKTPVYAPAVLNGSNRNRLVPAGPGETGLHRRVPMWANRRQVRWDREAGGTAGPWQALVRQCSDRSNLRPIGRRGQARQARQVLLGRICPGVPHRASGPAGSHFALLRPHRGVTQEFDPGPDCIVAGNPSAPSFPLPTVSIKRLEAKSVTRWAPGAIDLRCGEKDGQDQRPPEQGFPG